MGSASRWPRRPVSRPSSAGHLLEQFRRPPAEQLRPVDAHRPPPEPHREREREHLERALADRDEPLAGPDLVEAADGEVAVDQLTGRRAAPRSAPGPPRRP